MGWRWRSGWGSGDRPRGPRLMQVAAYMPGLMHGTAWPSQPPQGHIPAMARQPPCPPAQSIQGHAGHARQGARASQPLTASSPVVVKLRQPICGSPRFANRCTCSQTKRGEAAGIPALPREHACGRHTVTQRRRLPPSRRDASSKHCASAPHCAEMPGCMWQARNPIAGVIAAAAPSLASAFSVARCRTVLTRHAHAPGGMSHHSSIPCHPTLLQPACHCVQLELTAAGRAGVAPAPGAPRRPLNSTEQPPASRARRQQERKRGREKRGS